MSMNGPQMGNEVVAAIQGVTSGSPTPEQLALVTEIWQAICTAIVVHIQTNARAVGTDSDGDTHNLNIT